MVSSEKYAIFLKFKTQMEKEKKVKFQRAPGEAAAPVRSPVINVY